jgi:hypothetical protein
MKIIGSIGMGIVLMSLMWLPAYADDDVPSVENIEVILQNSGIPSIEIENLDVLLQNLDVFLKDDPSPLGPEHGFICLVLWLLKDAVDLSCEIYRAHTYWATDTFGSPL